MIEWRQDGIDPQWYIAEGIGSVRGPKSYRAGGWWFLPAWEPDEMAFDVGPFKTLAAAKAVAAARASNKGAFEEANHAI